MKKIFTLVLALMGFAGVANAATVDDIAVCKHSYVLCFDDWDNNGGGKPGKGQLFGNGFFLDVTGGTVSTGKGKVNLSVVNEADDNHVTQYIADKYGADYPDDHFNSWRLKNAQDVIAMKVTAKSKLIFFLQGNNKSGKDARIPKISKNADLSDPLNDAPDENHPTTDAGFRFEWTAPDDMLIYIGTYNGDTFFSYLIVEANEAPGTPTVKVGDQKYEGGLWFREVTCKANDMVEEGSTEKIPTVVTYTTDGSAPTAASTLYTEPIKCYKDMTIKFQAFMNFGDGKPSDDFICDGADNDANVNFKFDAPSIAVDGANVTITTPYAGQGGTNFYTLNGGSAVQGDAATLTESATVVAYTEIANGEYGKFTSSSTSKDAYVLNAIKEKKTIAITSADVVVDEEATATSTDGSTVYKVENGAISADKTDFFVKNLTFSVVKDANYQVPAGQEAYIQMSNTNITFFVAEGDSVDVKVTTTKNSCKTLNPDNDESVTTDRKNYVNVSGTTYGNDDVTAENGNIIEFGLKGAEGGSYFTFQKYSGTGNILISSIEITPAAATPAETETVLWEGTALVNGWADQPYLLSDGGKELTDNNAKAGDKIRFYCSAPDDNWQMELTSGHWDGMYFRYAPKDQGPEADGSARAYEIVDISNGYFDFVVTDEFLAKATASQGWGGVFVLNGDGNLTVTKLTLVQGGATGIAPVKTVKAQSSAIYNLAGQRVDANYKGVVIVNGKKMIQK